jgi:hypothetical protein
MMPSALSAVAAAAERLRASEELHRDAILAASDAGASLRQIAAAADVSHEHVRRIVRHRPHVTPYWVTVEHRGVAPVQARLLVRATSPESAGDLATWIAEHKHGGIFESKRVRRAGKDQSAYPMLAYDDVDVWPTTDLD